MVKLTLHWEEPPDRTHDLRIMRPTRCQLRYCHLFDKSCPPAIHNFPVACHRPVTFFRFHLTYPPNRNLS